MKTRKRIWGGWVLCVALILAGCGSEPNSDLFDVSGTVAFDGEPVPAGHIEFIPLRGSGDPVFASIQDGEFDISADGKSDGLKPGWYNIKVSGFDGVAHVDDNNEINYRGSPLFPQYETTKMFEFEDTTLDIKIEYPDGR